MKKLMFITMIGLSTMLVGCSGSFEDASDRDKAWMSHGNYTGTKVIEIEGHKYIIMVGFKCGGIIHAESCGCKK
jgi:major membrane immunogen (membrane-anchored lipoprotein)